MADLGQKLRRRLVRYGVLRGALNEGTTQDMARIRSAATLPEAASPKVKARADKVIAELPDGLLEAFQTAFDPRKVHEGQHQDATRLQLFVHVPKTAGSALLFGLRDGFDEVTPVPFDSAPTALVKAMQAALSATPTKATRVLIGHFDWKAAQPFLEGGDGVRAASMIRNPADRLLSQYLYNGSETHPNHIKFRARFPSFRAYLDSVNPSLQLRRMAGRRALAGQMSLLIKHYTFIGVTEHFDTSLTHYSRSHGLPNMREHVVNVAPKTPWQQVELTPEMREEICLKHIDDWVLFTILEPLFCAKPAP